MEDRTKSPWNVRPAAAGDRAALAQLLERAEAPGGGEALAAWLDAPGPAGRRAVVWIAGEPGADRFAGCLALVPWPMQGATTRGALAWGICERGRGIEAALCGAMRASTREQGVDAVFAVASDAFAWPSDAPVASELTRHVRPLGVPGAPGAINRVASRLLVPYARAHLDPATYEDTRVEAMWRAARGRTGACLARDARAYTWRFVDAPLRQEAFVILRETSAIGACALERRGRALRIVDLVAPPEELGAALRGIARFARGDVDELEILAPTTHPLGRALWKHGFVPRGEKKRVLVVGGEPTRAGEPFFATALESLYALR